jgi:hypothetical protein
LGAAERGLRASDNTFFGPRLMMLQCVGFSVARGCCVGLGAQGADTFIVAWGVA